MTEKQFLENVYYNFDFYRNEMVVMYGESIISTLDFSETLDRMVYDETNLDLCDSVALESSLANQLITEHEN
jgi:hypothetical protein